MELDSMAEFELAIVFIWGFRHIKRFECAVCFLLACIHPAWECKACVFKEACQNCFVKKGLKSPSPSDKPKFSVLIIFILLVTEGAPLQNLNEMNGVSDTWLVILYGQCHFSSSGNSICSYYAKVTDWEISDNISSLPLMQRVSGLVQRSINPVCWITKLYLSHF